MQHLTNLDAALQYANLGVLIFPCHWIRDGACSCGDPECKSPGKHPIKQLAPQGHKNATNDAATLTAWWSAFPHANIAMSLAVSGLVVIDIDPRNGGNETIDVLEAQHGRIASDVEQLTGGGGRHIVFVAAEGDRFPGKLGAGIDVKHDGYIMVWPSNHVSGKSYEWEGESDLMEGKSPSDAPAWLALPKSDEYNVNIAPAAAGMGIGAMLESEIDELRSALTFIPNIERDDWLTTGMALHSIDSGQAGFSLWENWSATCSKYDAQDQCRVWFSFHGKPNQRNKESLFFRAAELGWVNPMKKTVAPEVQAAAEKVALRLVGGKEPELSLTEPESTCVKPFPVEGLEEISAIIGASSYLNYPDASRLAAVQLACLAASRRYVGDNGEGCHVYFGLSSVSVGMIRYTVNALQTLLTQAGMRQLFSSSRKSTSGIIHDQLIKRPAHLYCVEDFGKMLQQSKKQFGNGSMEHALDTLGSIYSKSILQIDQDETVKPGRSDPENRVVYAPAMSMLGLVSQDQLTILTRASEIGSGLMVNMLMAICNENLAITNSDPLPIHVPEWLSHQLATMRGLNFSDKKHDGTFDFANDRGDFPPHQIVVPLPKTSSYDAVIMALSDKRTMIPLLHGARVTMRRIAIALAAWDNPMAPVCTDEIMSWSAGFVVGHMSRFMDNFRVMQVGEDGRSSVYQQLLKTIIDAGISGLSIQGMRDSCHPFKTMEKDKREALINLLEEDEEIQFVKMGKRKFWVASRFVKNNSTAEVRKCAEVETSAVKSSDDAALSATAEVRK